MPCYDNYITIDQSTPSRSGLYATNLPGVELSTLELLTKEDQIDYLEFWDMIYKRAWENFITDLTDEMQSKFFVDFKLVSRETSRILATINTTTGLAGVTIEFALPRYARLHIVSAEIESEATYSSPEFEIKVLKDNADGEELYSATSEISAGKNSVFIDQDFDVEKVFVGYDPELYSLRSSENKRYNNLYSPYYYFDCTTCEFDCGGYRGRIEQVNGGGLNVKYNVICSVEKFACQNINLFKMAFYYRIGLELVYERSLGNRLNRFMTMTAERKEDHMMFFNTEYMKALKQAVRGQNMREDTYCFSCKEIVSKKSELP